MKVFAKIIGFTSLIIILLYFSDKIYRVYKDYYLTSNEAVVYIHSTIPEDKIDKYFDLPEGTFNYQEHAILFGIRKKDASALNAYANLPIKRFLHEIDCNENFSRGNQTIINKNDLANLSTLYIRLINRKAISSNYLGVREPLSKDILAKKTVSISYKFGKINYVKINNNSTELYCSN